MIYHYVSKYTQDDYIEHHGIIGQKWGVRRFQNKDGSLTSEGKRHTAGETSTSSKMTRSEKAYLKRTQKAMHRLIKSTNKSVLKDEKKLNKLIEKGKGNSSTAERISDRAGLNAFYTRAALNTYTDAVTRLYGEKKAKDMVKTKTYDIGRQMTDLVIRTAKGKKSL